MRLTSLARNFSIVVAVLPHSRNFPNFLDLLRFLRSIAMKNQRWTEEDLAKLRSMAGKFPTEEIARALGRTPSAVKMKAYLLKVSLGWRRRGARAA